VAPGNGTKWQMEADYLQACSCDYGCPCEFEAPPTQGFCEGAGAWRINRGRYGGVSLDGLGLGFAAHWPQAIHLGNGTAVVFIDEKANEQQREALTQIASGQAGGMPFEIIVQTLSKVDIQFVPMEFKINGSNSSAKIGSAVAMGFEPIKNPVSGEVESIRIEHGTGFLFKGAEVVSGKECRAALGGKLDFSWPNKAGFVTQVKYAN
jgi:hypothetical protein